MKIAVTGPRGRLGSELVRIGCTPIEADITKPGELSEAIGNIDPDIIVNCAAFTNVDAAENDVEHRKAILVNTHGVEHLLRISKRRFRLFHISTDYIFSGKRGPYSEKYKQYDPVNSYGYSKLGGDLLILNDVFPGKVADVIIRTTGLYGNHEGKKSIIDFFRHMLGVSPISVADDVRGNQTYIPHLAEAILHLTSRETYYPVINIASREVVSRYEFALMVRDILGKQTDEIVKIKAAKVPGWIARRPTHGGLNVNLALKLDIPIYSIREGIEAYKKEHNDENLS